MDMILIAGAVVTAGVICFLGLFFYFMRSWNELRTGAAYRGKR
jgi:hypothetical protein